MSKEIQNKLAASGLVPVVVLEDANDALPTAKALLAGGLCVMEITFRTACAAEAHFSGGGKLPGDDRGRRHRCDAGAV